MAGYGSPLLCRIQVEGFWLFRAFAWRQNVTVQKNWFCQGPCHLLEIRTYGRASPFRSTSAEFFDPNAMQLHTACCTVFFLPGDGT